MAEDLDNVIRRILGEYRHLMTEAERRADRAFVYQEQANAAGAAASGESHPALQQALSDPEAAALFAKGRRPFLEDMANRIAKQYGSILPKCGTCGAVLKSPSPKSCFDCG